MKILLVEDDTAIAELLKKALADQHYSVDVATDGQMGLGFAEAYEYDLIVLDVMLPKLNGIQVCQQRRNQGDRTPILLLTAQDTNSSKIQGLDAGADDYVVKPFDLHELLARIRALLRRGRVSFSPVLGWGELHLDPNSCEVTYAQQPLRLTSKEYRLLELFVRNSRRIFSQSSLLNQLWSFEDEFPSENAVRAHVKSLRQKLKQAGAPDLIETIYGLGYRLKDPDPTPQGTKPQTTAAPEGVTPAPHPKMPAAIAAIWEKHQGKYRDRIQVVERAAQALQAGHLEIALKQQAQREAHTLAGALGIFGWMEASRLASEAEQLLQHPEISPAQQAQFANIVRALQQTLGEPVTATAMPVQTDSPSYRLLMVDADQALVNALVTEAATMGFAVDAVTRLSQARQAIDQTRPDLVLLDLDVEQATPKAFDLLAELATYQPPIPAIILTAQESLDDRVRVARLGAAGFLRKPVSTTELMETMTQVLQISHRPEAKLLIVDDDPQLLDYLQTLLTPWGFKLTLLDNSHQFWEALQQSMPDLLILDVEMPEFSGIDLCQVVRNDPYWSELPVLFLSAHRDAATIQQVFAAGADDYVTKPIIGPELISRVLNRLERTQILKRFAALYQTRATYELGARSDR